MHALRDSYLERAPDYDGGMSVPGLVDVPSGHLVGNDYDQLPLDFGIEWKALHREGAPELYPERLRDEIDSVNEFVYRDVGNGVYRCGLAPSQQSYDRAVHILFAGLDRLEDRLTRRRGYPHISATSSAAPRSATARPRNRRPRSTASPRSCPPDLDRRSFRQRAAHPSSATRDGGNPENSVNGPVCRLRPSRRVRHRRRPVRVPARPRRP